MKTQANLYKGLGGYGTLGFEIVLSFLIGVFGGKWLDDHYGTTPWFFLGGLALGSVLSVKAILRALRVMRQVAEKEEREEGNPKPLYESTSERLERKQRGEKVDEDPVVGRASDATSGEAVNHASDPKPKDH